MHDDLGGAALAAFLLDRAQHVQRGALGAADVAGAAAMRAGDEAGLGERRAQPLAAHLQQAEMADMADLDARAVVLQRLLQPALDHATLCLRALHVDEVDDDQPGEVAQPQLPRHLVGGLEVGAQRRLLDAALARRAARVDVDGDQRLGLVDDQVAAGAELHRRRQHRVELRLDLVPWRRAAARRRARAAPCAAWVGISMRMKSRAARQPSSPSTRISSTSRE